MSDNNHGWGRSTVVVGADQQPAGAHQPAFDRSVGTSRRGTVYVGTTEEQRGPGLVAQEQTTGGDLNTLRYTDQGRKSVAVRSAPTAAPYAFMGPDGVHPIPAGRDVTVKDTVNIPTIGVLKVREALALGLLRSDDLQVAVPEKSIAMQQYEARQKAEQEGKQAPVDAEAAKVEAALMADYNATVTELDKVMTSVGVSSDSFLDALAKGDQGAISADVVQKVADKMGADNYAQTVEALTLHVYGAADRALAGTGQSLDAVMDVVEQPQHARRWGQAYTHYLRTGSSDLIAAFVREVAKGLR